MIRLSLNFSADLQSGPGLRPLSFEFEFGLTFNICKLVIHKPWTWEMTQFDLIRNSRNKK